MFITDGVYSFVKFNYPEHGINWATPYITSSDSKADIQRKLSYRYGWFPMAIGGYSSGDFSTGVPVTREYVNASNQIQMMDIDNTTGNFPGKSKEWDQIVYISTCLHLYLYLSRICKQKKTNLHM